MLNKISRAVTICSCFFLLSCTEDRSHELEKNLSKSLLNLEVIKATVYKNPTYKNRYYSIVYKSDGLKIKGIVAFPKHFDSKKKYPIIIFNRGGNRGFGYVDKLNHYFHSLTKDKYIVFSSQLRGSPGSDGEDEYGGKDINDTLNLIKIAKSYAFVDLNNIFMHGGSRGGMTSYLVMKSGVRLNAVAVSCGISDLFMSAKLRPRLESLVFEKLILNYKTKKQEELYKRSAVKWPEKVNSPLLLLHGDADWRVNVKQSQSLYDLLKARSHPVKLRVFKGGNHSLTGFEKEESEEMHSWFAKYMK